MTWPADGEESLRAVKLLHELVKAYGPTGPELDHRLGKVAGHTSQLLDGRLELGLRDTLEILEALDLEPELFFRALSLAPESPSPGGLGTRRLFQSLSPLAQPGPLSPPSPPALEPAELDRRVRFVIREALSERQHPENP